MGTGWVKKNEDGILRTDESKKFMPKAREMIWNREQVWKNETEWIVAFNYKQ